MQRQGTRSDTKHIQLRTSTTSRAVTKTIVEGERIWLQEELKMYDKRDIYLNLEFNLLYEFIHDKTR